MPARPDKNVRRAAVSALRAWAKGHDYAETLVDRHARRNHLSAADRALLNAILLGVLRNKRLLDHWIANLRKGKLDHETRDILRVGLCQLLVLEIADHAAVNETVACARSPVRGLINAVLRRAVAARKTLLAERDTLAPPLRYSHPDWLWKRWKKQFGGDDATTLLAWNNRPAEVFMRFNPLRAEGFPESADPAIVLERSPADGFARCSAPVPAAWLEEGLVYIQDPATRHAVELLAPQPGETILDACAAPGGKAALIAAAMQNDGHLLCTDSNEKRIPRLGENLSRLGVTCAATASFDWTTKPPAEWHRKFDAILLDVPCSNTGVLRRRVDARWRLRLEQIDELTGIQRAILRNALPCLVTGGRLVYSTCSLEPEENGTLIEEFAASRRGIELRETREAVPFRDGTDGAFAALMA
ncbi:MAG: hypothetical protein HKN82_11330 [Akkermansiaceae bacterium]|nr:hypothetical protein [Akkermansiaceae bacterium]NNM29912.1 hypothetical protein [Akkermansiaceae bacterium]